MAGFASRGATSALVLGTALTLIVKAVSAAPIYGQKNLVTDDAAALAAEGFKPAVTIDPLLVNPWGIAASATGPWWTSNQGTDSSTLYNGNTGAKSALEVSVPSAPAGPNGPTGQVFNGTASFALTPGNPARFIFANLDGTISGWNPAVAPTSAIVVHSAPGAIYTGLASGNSGGSEYLYAADEAGAKIDVLDSSFAPVALAGNFTDPTLPAGLVPFNIQRIGTSLFVTYAIGGPASDLAPLGSGAVNEFTLDGQFVRRVTDGGNLSSPWGIARAPGNFGEFSNALLVANFSENFGYINAYDYATGAFLGQLLREDLSPLIIPQLWAIAFGNGSNGGATDHLFFAAGIGDEAHGLFGYLAVPGPAGLALLGLGAGTLLLARRRP